MIGIGMTRMNLNGVWELRWDDGERGEKIGALLKGTARPERAWPARVPGSVHETLIEQGIIADPNTGTDVLACRWVEETVWHYRRTFDMPALQPAERAWLVFDCLDLAAAIHLNGVEIGRHNSAFYPCRLEVTDRVQAGTNILVVSVESGLFHAMDRSADGMAVQPGSRFTKRPWLRKTQSEHGWDWAPRLLNVGIPGSVRLESAATVRWDSCSIRTELSDDLTAGVVKVTALAEGVGETPFETTLSLRVAGRQTRVPVTLQPGMNRIEATLNVPRPKLWWPVGHGAQPLYEAVVDMDGVETVRRTVGFRHVRINQERHPEAGQYFIVEVNRKPIFGKGGNFVPADLIQSRLRPERYETLIDRLLEANGNLLRVWGGGLYEKDEFYEICDARGVLVWQEFIFACAKYPATDEAFLADVKREAAHQVRRLAHHPSLAVWCGNNEMEWGNYQWGYEQGVAHPDYALFHMVLPRIVALEDGTRFYQPSSPFSPDHELPNADHVGDQHPWSVGFADTDFRKYRDMICRFPNEGGIMGPTALPTALACTDTIGSFAWEVHDNSIVFSTDYAADRMIANWTGRAIGGMDMQEYVYWGGVVQGCGLAEYVKNFRRRMFDSASAIFWMYNDVWPCVRSWTIIDYYLRRTPAFWPVRRAFAPVTTVVTREGDTVRVYGVNEGGACHARLRFGLMALAGEYPRHECRRVELPANASVVLAEFGAREWDELGIASHVAFAVLEADGRELARDALFLPLFREMQWPEAAVKVKRVNGQAVFSCNVFAWRVCLDLDGEQALTDNFFDVYPGIPTVLDWPERLGEPRVLRTGNDVASEPADDQ